MCKHVPKESAIIVSGRNKKAFVFDSVQECKKCEKKIRMASKAVYLGMLFLVCIVYFAGIFLLSPVLIEKSVVLTVGLYGALNALLLAALFFGGRVVRWVLAD